MSDDRPLPAWLETLPLLLEHWRTREAFIREHLDFNIRNNNMPDDAELDAVKECADELAAALADLRAAWQTQRSDTTCDNDVGRPCRELWPADRASWCDGCAAWQAQVSTRKEYDPHPDCPTCHGTGECSNAQFRCHCRWHKTGCAVVHGRGNCDCPRATWQAQEGGWQPIATAPKDGTQILLYGRWNRTRDLFGSGAWRSFNDGDTAQWSWGWTLEPSHWMPLPAPPAAAEP